MTQYIARLVVVVLTGIQLTHSHLRDLITILSIQQLVVAVLAGMQLTHLH